MTEQRIIGKDTLEQEEISGLIDKFITAHDVKESSKITYRKCLKQFMMWIAGEGTEKPTT